MTTNYEINSSTLAIIPISKNVSKIIEEEEIITVNKTTTEIIDDSCKFFGSSYLGRHEGTKNLIGIHYKAPIVIEESNDIIFFPTASPRFDNCYWISLKKILKYKKEDGKTIIVFKNGYELPINISTGSLENQILRSTLLESVLRSRKMS